MTARVKKSKAKSARGAKATAPEKEENRQVEGQGYPAASAVISDTEEVVMRRRIKFVQASHADTALAVVL
jgi:hypothetical protein